MINEHNSPQIHHRVSAETSHHCLDLYKMSTKGEREIEREAFFIFPKGVGRIYEGDEYQAS